jgi:WhiB family redox-sensing transcriptional regulator
MSRAACRDADPELFFPPKGKTHLGLQAQIICFGCEVREECKDYKRVTESSDGIWAGEFSKRDD